MSSNNNGIIERRGKLTNAGITDFNDDVKPGIEISGPEDTEGAYHEETHSSTKKGYRARASTGSLGGRHCLLNLILL